MQQINKASEIYEVHPNKKISSGVNTEGEVFISIRRKGAPLHTPYTRATLEETIKHWQTTGQDPDFFIHIRDKVMPALEAKYKAAVEAKTGHVVGGMSDADRARRTRRHMGTLGSGPG